MELERQTSIFIVAHQAVLRAIYAYFMNYSEEKIPYIEIPLHHVIKLEPKAYGCREERFDLNIPAVVTHRDPWKE
jgi:6-phosphofructo-2-kinase/fructose-2,6-biphosphatase 2